MIAEIKFKTVPRDVTEGHPAYQEEKRRAMIEALWGAPFSLDDLTIITREIQGRIRDTRNIIPEDP